MRSKTSRGEGLVPRWGGGGAWQNPPRASFACVPPAANVVRGLVPRWGRGGTWQNPPRASFACVSPAANVVRSKTSRIFPRWGWVGPGKIRSAVEDFARRGAFPPLGLGWAWQNPPRASFACVYPRSQRSAGARPPLGRRGAWQNPPRASFACVPPAANVVRGLVPRWGRGGTWQNPPRASFACVSPAANVVRSKTSRGEGLFPRWGWVGPGKIRHEPHSPVCTPAANVVRGLVPRWGRGGEWQNPPRQLALPNHNFGFSYPGVPAEGGMSDCNENRPLRQTLIGRSRHPFVYPAPHFVIPAKAGIQKGCGGGRQDPRHLWASTVEGESRTLASRPFGIDSLCTTRHGSRPTNPSNIACQSGTSARHANPAA